MAEPYRVIVVEDDPDVALYTKLVLEKHELCVVMTIADPRDVLSAVSDFDPEVVLTDVELPGMSGLDLIAQIREVRPGTPVVVMTAHASLDYAVTALRNQADEFLTKPVQSADLVAHVTRLADAARDRVTHAPRPQVVLAIGAHPDDVEIGVGGILAAHAAAGDSVTILTLSQGHREGGVKTAWNEGSTAAASIGATLILEEGEGYLTNMQSMIDRISQVVSELEPTIVYVHSKNDRNQDHRAAHGAALAATTSVRMIACYQGTGATVDFRPNRFVSIDRFTDAKVVMVECFAMGGIRPNYIKTDFVLATARAWSRFGEGDYCEALEIIRDSAPVI